MILFEGKHKDYKEGVGKTGSTIMVLGSLGTGDCRNQSKRTSQPETETWRRMLNIVQFMFQLDFFKIPQSMQRRTIEVESPIFLGMQ